MSTRVIAAFLIATCGIAPENPSPVYIEAVVDICTEIYRLDLELCYCIIEHESEWNPNARGDNGAAVGLWQWHEESIKTAFRDMGIMWDWRDGDPRLNVWASSLAAAHALSKGWRWWTTQDSCEALGR